MTCTKPRFVVAWETAAHFPVGADRLHRAVGLRRQGGRIEEAVRKGRCVPAGNGETPERTSMRPRPTPRRRHRPRRTPPTGSKRSKSNLPN